jgi:peptide-methionine (S)-S-oxide reductase
LIKTIFLAGGCFWCTEAVFKRVSGVLEVLPGYIGGTIKNPSYREVCNGLTGHAEAISVSYDTSQVNLSELLLIFFNTHDPTTLNRQGNDIGTQYRSGIYFTDIEQKETVKVVINQLINENVFKGKIITEIKDATTFYEAEKNHHDYYNRNKEQPYCVFTINPKIEKINKYFSRNLN